MTTRCCIYGHLYGLWKYDFGFRLPVHLVFAEITVGIPLLNLFEGLIDGLKKFLFESL